MGETLMLLIKEGLVREKDFPVFVGAIADTAPLGKKIMRNFLRYVAGYG